MNYLDSDDNNYWYEMAKSIQLYDSLVNIYLKYESIGKRIIKKRDILLPKIYKKIEPNWKEDSLKITCSGFSFKIIGFLVLDDNFLKQELAPEKDESDRKRFRLFAI